MPRRVVLTGGPGAGKTAVLEILARSVCEHVVVLPEAASIVFGGGFPRRPTVAWRRAAQRAIFQVQLELERGYAEEPHAAIVLCDRGLLDGLAYWEGDEADFFRDTGFERVGLLARYDAVIHLRTPTRKNGYDHRNPLRTETAEQAARIDERILEAWSGHPRRFVVDSADDFLEKARRAIELIRAELPPCCAEHSVAHDETPPRAFGDVRSARPVSYALSEERDRRTP